MNADNASKMSEMASDAAGETEQVGDTVIGPHNDGAEADKVDAPVSKLNILRAAIFMFADSMLADLRTIRNATTVEEARAPVNLMIDRLTRLSEAAEATDSLA